MSHSQSTDPTVTAVRWFARISGALLVGFLALFVVGHGGPPNVFAQPFPVQLEFLGMAMIALGAIAGWCRAIGGGILSLAGFLLFCVTEVAVNGAMPGGVIPLFCIPGVALILGGVLSPQTGQRVTAS